MNFVDALRHLEFKHAKNPLEYYNNHTEMLWQSSKTP